MLLLRSTTGTNVSCTVRLNIETINRRTHFRSSDWQHHDFMTTRTMGPQDSLRKVQFWVFRRPASSLKLKVEDFNCRLTFQLGLQVLFCSLPCQNWFSNLGLCKVIFQLALQWLNFPAWLSSFIFSYTYLPCING